MNQVTAPAAVLAWQEEFELKNERMDRTHVEFVDLVNAVSSAAPQDQAALYQQLIDHTEAHFAQEERWMKDTGFGAGNCHEGQHANVLEVMREVATRSAEGNPVFITRMIEALVEWFPLHADTMDAALAFHMSQVGYDNVSETLTRPLATAATEGVAACGTDGCH